MGVRGILFGMCLAASVGGTATTSMAHDRSSPTRPFALCAPPCPRRESRTTPGAARIQAQTTLQESQDRTEKLFPLRSCGLDRVAAADHRERNHDSVELLLG